MRPRDASDIVLVVDDSPDTLRMLTDALEDAGMTVLVAIEGAQALTVYVTAAVAEGLDRALGKGGESGYAFEAEDGHYTVAIDKIVFVKRFARESRVGFGASA